MLTDTHTHLYLPDFEGKREEVMERAFEQGVERLFLPNIDSGTVVPLYQLCSRYPGKCFPMLGLHPGSVREDFREELEAIEKELASRACVAVGEIGMDLYWDRTFIKEQETAFRTQVDWAIGRDLPIVIHSRESFEEIYRILQEKSHPRLRGIFHCFTGTYEQALKAIEAGFYLGIGGVVTFKKSGLGDVIRRTGPDHIVLETDSPYLAPAPFRGKQNESSYLTHIAAKLSEIYEMPGAEIARITTENSKRIFKV